MATDPKFCLKAPLAPIYTNVEGGGGGGGTVAEKTAIFDQNFQKSV